MTTEQFAALAQLMQMRAGPAQEAARMVLVDGITQADAGRRTGLSPQGVNNAVTRARKAMALAQIAGTYNRGSYDAQRVEWLLNLSSHLGN